MSDVGLEALDAIHRKLLVDEPWTIREERAFSWIAYRLAAKVEASPVFTSADLPISRVTTTIDVVEDVGLPQSEAEQLVCTLNRVVVGGAYVYAPLERTIRVMLAHNVHAETLPWRATEIASEHIIALTLAEQHAEPLAERIRGRVARRLHPQSGGRMVPDDMLNVLEEHYKRYGAEPSRFANADEMRDVYEMLRNTYDFSAGSSADGLAIETAFGEDETTLIELKTDERHPIVGNGLAVVMMVRVAPVLPEACRLANHFNLLQFAPGEVVAALGAWTVRPIGDSNYIARSRFVANANYSPGRAMDCAQSAILQAWWVDQQFHPGMPRRSAAAVLARRHDPSRPR